MWSSSRPTDHIVTSWRVVSSSRQREAGSVGALCTRCSRGAAAVIGALWLDPDPMGSTLRLCTLRGLDEYRVRRRVVVEQGTATLGELVEHPIEEIAVGCGNGDPGVSDAWVELRASIRQYIINRCVAAGDHGILRPWWPGSVRDAEGVDAIFAVRARRGARSLS